MDPTDLYTLLGVGRRATTDEIEAAYAAWLARTGAGRPVGETADRLRYAYEVLSNPQRRSLYDSLVAETTGGGALEFELVVSADRLALLDTLQVVYALLTLTPRQALEDGRRPLNLGLVIDRSTSMRGERLAKVTAAVALLLDKLAPDDALSLVSFSDRAEVVLPAATLGAAAQSVQPETAAAWRAPRRQLQAIAASGGTEIFQGLRAGLAEVTRLAGEARTSHLILLTDGHTYGDADDCLRLAAEAAGRGIGLTAFGIGADWNDSFLDALVAPSGGQSHFIEQPADVLPHLEERLKGLGAIYARNVTLQRGWPAPFTLRGGFKLTPFPQPLAVDADPIPLGDLEGRAPLSLLLEFLVAPQSMSARFRLPLHAHYTTPGGAEEAIGRDAPFVVLNREGEAAPPAALIEAARRLNLYRMQEKAWEEAQSGKLDTAAARMRRLTARYLETGDLRLAKQAQLEAQRLAHLGTMSLEGRKVLKYGTRSLMGQTGT
ncbi:VWA domain-containing protein [Promineifilum sp.]|uniref:VWA domain-containing protein n=1 Tax=Promineifilum sp. TaxID=2664178 RepID=UPI0035B34EA2